MKFNQNNIKRAIVSAFVVGSVGISAASYADDTQMLVKTTVGASCIVSIDASMTFADYDPVIAHATDDLVKQQIISAQCTTGAQAKIDLNVGLNPVDSTATISPSRRMKHIDTDNNVHYLNYNLYKGSDVAAPVWGGGATGGKIYDGIGTAQNIIVYGRVGPNQPAVFNATYTDTVVVSYNLG